MPVRRLILASLLAAAALPGVWLRSPPTWGKDNGERSLEAVALPASTPAYWPKGLVVVRAWHLTSGYTFFGGYSALVPTADRALTATSDVGLSMWMQQPDRPGPIAVEFGKVPPPRQRRRQNSDIEAATSDPRTGRRWYAYEALNVIQRFERGDTTGRAVRPPAMQHWPLNGGPEAMARLRDGRFVVLSEDPPWLSAGARPGLLFPGDPLDGAKPVEFAFRPPIGFHPSDMAALPDGRVVILLRAVDLPFPPFFRCMLIVADPAQIAPGREWPWRKLADLADPLPVDNYEGLAIVPAADGVDMWLISDDNFARFQRTLLLQLHWRVPPREAAGI